MLLCDSCKNDIIDEPFLYCGACAKRPASGNGICKECKVPYERMWCMADRRDNLQRLIGNFKFTNAKSASTTLADMLNDHLPEMPQNVVVVPVPTVGPHIRQRGYDHMLLIARRFAKLRSLQVNTGLQRASTAQQRSAGRTLRVKQAKSAFKCNTNLDSDKIYLLMDDVITTGATVKYATKTLLDAGATKVWVASISRQPMD